MYNIVQNLGVTTDQMEQMGKNYTKKNIFYANHFFLTRKKKIIIH